MKLVKQLLIIQIIFFFDLIKKISKQNNSNKKYEIMKLHSYPPKL